MLTTPVRADAVRGIGRWRAVLLAVGLVALTTAVFAPVSHYDFVSWDDPGYVTENSRVKAGLSWSAVGWALTTGEGYYWHPLTWLSHLVDVELFGMEPGRHHLTNLLLHLVATLLLFLIFRRLTGAPGRSAFVAALFAVHPLHVEPVAWVAERKEVLGGVFWMLTIGGYAAYARRPSLLRYLGVAAATAAALMAKPMAVTLPFVLMLLDVWPLARARSSREPEHLGDTRSAVSRPSWAWLVAEKLPLAALSCASAWITYANQLEAGAVRDLARIPLADRAANAVVSYVAYIGAMVWPANLAAFYPYPREITPWWWAALAALIAASALAVALVRRHPYLFVGWFWYVGTLVPVIGLVQVGNQARADRFTYLPIVGLFVAAAWGVPALAARWSAARRALPWLAVMVVLAAAAAARAQLPHWKDSYALWSNAAAVTTGNERAHWSLGLLFDADGRRPEAIAHYAEAARLVPRSAASLHHRIAVLLIEEGRLAEAIERLSLAVDLEPRNAVLHAALGAALERQGRFGEAVAAFKEAVRLQPDDWVSRTNLGVALERDGRSEEAVVAYRDAIRLRPDHGPAHANLAVSLARLGNLDEAIREGAESVRLDPTQAGWFYRLAVLYDRKGDRRAAMTALESALRVDPAHEAARTLLLDLTK